MQPLQDFLTPPPPTPTLPPAASPVANATATPIPTLPPAPAVDAAAQTAAQSAAQAATQATTPVGQQTANLAAMVALFIYLIFFGIMGYRRGATRELIVLLVALGFSFLLRQFEDFVVVFFDRFGKGLAFITGQPIPEQSGLGAWAAANTQALLTLLWLAAVVITYLLTNRFVRKSKSDGWAAILGVLNGLVFGSIFAPLLTSLIFPNVPVQGPGVPVGTGQLPVFSFLSNIWQQIVDLALRSWALIQPFATNFFFLFVILLILLAAMTLRTGVKPKS